MGEFGRVLTLFNQLTEIENKIMSHLPWIYIIIMGYKPAAIP